MKLAILLGLVLAVEAVSAVAYFKVTVVYPDGGLKFFLHGTKATDTIGSIKRRVHNLHPEIEIASEQLFYSNKLVQDNKTLADYNIIKDTILQLKVAPKRASATDRTATTVTGSM